MVVFNNAFYGILFQCRENCDFFILFFTYTIIMSVLNIEVLKEIVEKLPGDFTVEFDDLPVSDKFEVDVSGKKLVLKKY